MFVFDVNLRSTVARRVLDVSVVGVVFVVVTWHIVRIASVEQQMPVPIVAEGRKDAGNRHAGATIAPQMT